MAHRKICVKAASPTSHFYQEVRADNGETYIEAVVAASVGGKQVPQAVLISQTSAAMQALREHRPDAPAMAAHIVEVTDKQAIANAIDISAEAQSGGESAHAAVEPDTAVEPEPTAAERKAEVKAEAKADAKADKAASDAVKQDARDAAKHKSSGKE